MIKLKYIGQDDWSQDLYQGPDRKKYVYVDGSIYTMTKEGEPLAKVNFEYELERPKNESNDESSAIQAQIISIICGTFERDGSIKSWKMKEKSEPGPPQFESFDETDFDSVITRATKRFSVKGDRLIEDLLERIGKGEMTITEAAEHIIKADVSTAPMLMIEPHPDMFRHRFPIHEAMNSRWKPDIQKIYSRQIDAAVQDYRMMTEPELKKFCDMANKEEMISDGYFDRSDGFSNESQRKKVTEKLVKYMKSCLNGNPFDESINESSAPHFAARLEAFLDAPWQEDQEIYFVSDLRAALQKAGINDLGAAHPDKAKAVVRNMNSGIAGIRLQFMGDRFLDSLTSICESNGHLQPVSDDIITAAIEIDLKPNLFVHTIKQDGVHVEFGANVKMSTIEKLAEELRKMGRDVKATRGQASIVVNESLLTEGTAEELTAKLIDAGLPSDAFSIVYAPDSRKFAAIVQDGHRREAEQALTKAKIRYTQKARGRFVLNESSNEMTDDQIIRWIKDLDMPKQKTDRVIGHALEYHPKPKGPSELKEIVDDVLAKMGEKQFNESLITEAASGATCNVYCERWKMETDTMTVKSPSGNVASFNPNFVFRGSDSDRELINAVRSRYWEALSAMNPSSGRSHHIDLWLTREEMEACKNEAIRQKRGIKIRESLTNIPSYEKFAITENRIGLGVHPKVGQKVSLAGDKYKYAAKMPNIWTVKEVMSGEAGVSNDADPEEKIVWVLFKNLWYVTANESSLLELDQIEEAHYAPDGRPLNIQPIDPRKAQDEFENFLSKNRIFYPSDFDWRKMTIDGCMVMSFSKEAVAKKAVATIEKNSLWKAKYIGSEFVMGIDPKTGEDSRKHGYTSYMVQVLNLETAYSAANLGVKEKIKEYKFKRDLESNNWYGIEILARQHNDTELADAAEAARTAVAEVQRLIDQKYYWK